MGKPKVAYISSRESDITLTVDQLAGIDHTFERHLVRSEGEVIEAIKDADVVIDEAVPMGRSVIETMRGGTAIVSLGHGFKPHRR